MFGGGGDPLQAAIGGGSGGGGMMSSLSQRPSQQSQTLMAMQHHQQQQQDTSMYIGCLFLCCQCFASVKYSLHVMKLLLLKLLYLLPLGYLSTESAFFFLSNSGSCHPHVREPIF